MTQFSFLANKARKAYSEHGKHRCNIQLKEQGNKGKGNAGPRRHKNKGFYNFLSLSLRRSLSNRNQSIDLLCKSMDWFLDNRDHRHKGIKGKG